jgi:hypothetical protein
MLNFSISEVVGCINSDTLPFEWAVIFTPEARLIELPGASRYRGKKKKKKKKKKTFGRKLFISAGTAMLIIMQFWQPGIAEAGTPFNPLSPGTHYHYIAPWSGNSNAVYQFDEGVLIVQSGDCGTFRGDLVHTRADATTYQQWLGYWGYSTACNA